MSLLERFHGSGIKKISFRILQYVLPTFKDPEKLKDRILATIFEFLKPIRRVLRANALQICSLQQYQTSW